jgi:hypothetical protein
MSCDQIAQLEAQIKILIKNNIESNRKITDLVQKNTLFEFQIKILIKNNIESDKKITALVQKNTQLESQTGILIKNNIESDKKIVALAQKDTQLEEKITDIKTTYNDHKHISTRYIGMYYGEHTGKPSETSILK